MIGDLIIGIRTWMKQNLFCVHHYSHHIFLFIAWDECDKCGRKKNGKQIL